MNKPKMLRDMVLIRPEVYEKRTESGILLPINAQHENFKGWIIAVGPGTKDYEMSTKEGDYILYGNFKREEITYEGKPHIMMREIDVLGILPDKPMPKDK